MGEMGELLKDLWQYATGMAWGEMTEEEAVAEGEELEYLYKRVGFYLRNGILLSREEVLRLKVREYEGRK